MSWDLKPCGTLLADVSLWSADLGNLQRDVERLSPHADSFHIDVADGHFVADLLFFADMVAALRPHTDRPFHVHLMLEKPLHFVERFASAGADLITVHVETGEAEIREAIGRIRSSGKAAGMAVRLETPVTALAPYLEALDAVVLMGTELGVKGRSLAPPACGRIAELADLLQSVACRHHVVIIADGGIRKETVRLLRAAGADAVAAGSLVFQANDAAAMVAWIHAQGRRS
jgi:ribulose-phosphate 3-epimerase